MICVLKSLPRWPCGEACAERPVWGQEDGLPWRGESSPIYHRSVGMCPREFWREVVDGLRSDQAGRPGAWTQSDIPFGVARPGTPHSLSYMNHRPPAAPPQCLEQAGRLWCPPWTGKRVSPTEYLPLRLLHGGSQKTLAFHDLLQFHLQGLDGSRWVITSQTLDPVNRELPISHCGNVIILKEDDPVGVLYDSTGARKTWVSETGPTLHSYRWQLLTASQLWVRISSTEEHFAICHIYTNSYLLPLPAPRTTLKPAPDIKSSVNLLAYSSKR